MRINHPTIIFLFEIKVQFASVAGFWKGQGYVPVHVEEARGRAGGIWCLREERATFSFVVVEAASHAVTVSISVLSSSWCCTSVYASPSSVERDRVWKYLKGLRRRIKVPWMMIRDFNETMLPSDQNRGAFVSHRADKLAAMVEECSLMDINPTGFPYTWARKLQGEPLLLKKLDCFFFDAPWRTFFHEGGAAVLGRQYSDHHPLLARCAKLLMGRGPRPFRFEAMWT